MLLSPIQLSSPDGPEASLSIQQYYLHINFPPTEA